MRYYNHTRVILFSFPFKLQLKCFDFPSRQKIYKDIYIDFERIFLSISEIKMKSYTLVVFLMVAVLFVLTNYAESKMLMGKGGGNVDI